MQRVALYERIANRIDTSGGVDGCHPWVGSISRGEPVMWKDETTCSPRRVVFIAFSGLTLLPNQRVLSTCGSRLCCNPRHLYGGSAEQHVVQLRDTTGGPDACWPFMGFRFKGYGRMQVGKRGAPMLFAHRIAYELANGPIVGHVAHADSEKVVMHTCDNPPCCNPKHLRLGTDADNIADCVAKGRNSHGERHARRMKQAREKKAQPVTWCAPSDTSRTAQVLNSTGENT